MSVTIRCARRSDRPTHRSARGTESTPGRFDEGCSMHGESRIATRACPTMDRCDTSVLMPCRKSSIVVLSPRLSEPRAEAVRHIERLWFRHTTGSGGGGRYGLCWRSEELPTLDGDERSVPLVHPPTRGMRCITMRISSRRSRGSRTAGTPGRSAARGCCGPRGTAPASPRRNLMSR